MALSKLVTGTPDDDTDLKISTTFKALMCPSVLDAIFKKLSVPDLHSARLVCTKWGDVGSSILAKKGWLILDFCDVPLSDVVSLPDKFFRRVVISHLDVAMCKAIWESTFATNCDTLLPRMDQFTKDLHLYVGKWCGVPILKALANSHFPNLTSIRIRFMPGGYQRLSQDCQNFTGRSKLIKLDLILINCDENHELLTSICQSLINAGALNLEELRIDGDIYPDLSNCGKLKVLKYTFLQGRRQFNLPSLNNMLDAVSASIGKLDVNYGTQCDRSDVILTGLETYRLRLPRPMPNFTTVVFTNAALVFLFTGCGIKDAAFLQCCDRTRKRVRDVDPRKELPFWICYTMNPPK